MLVPRGFALYVSGRQLTYVKVPGHGNKILKIKGASSLYKDEAPRSQLAAVLAGDARDVCDLGRLGARVCVDWFHTGGIERLIIAPVTLGLAGTHLDHLAAAFEKGTWLDHQ